MTARTPSGGAARDLSVLALTRYGPMGASSRLRFMDWFAPLHEHGFEFTCQALLSDDYVTALYSGTRPGRADIAKGFGQRIRQLLASRTFDLIWVEKEIFPWLPFADDVAMALLRQPVVVDIDDAVFHYYDQHRSPLVRLLFHHKIDRMFAGAALVCAGNSYLAGRARRAGAQRVEILPTVVEESRYCAAGKPANNTQSLAIGWIGSPATDAYLAPIAATLNRFCKETGSEVRLIGARRDRDDTLDATVLPWSVASETKDLQALDVGIMPLPDLPFERGKCGFKLIQYMACGLPVIASPVGVNSDIVDHGKTGFLASTPDEWHEALLQLSRDPALRARMGEAGRQRFKTSFSREALAPRLAHLLRTAADTRRRGR